MSAESFAAPTSTRAKAAVTTQAAMHDRITISSLISTRPFVQLVCNAPAVASGLTSNPEVENTSEGHLTVATSSNRVAVQDQVWAVIGDW